MFKLDILNSDGSLYWTETFNSEQELDKWLDEEKQRPYWDVNFATTKTEVVNVSEQVQQELTNAAALNYLASTDWYVIRQIETGIPMPTDIASKRVQMRALIVR